MGNQCPATYALYQSREDFGIFHPKLLQNVITPVLYCDREMNEDQGILLCGDTQGSECGTQV